MRAIANRSVATLRMTKLLYDSGIPIVAGTDGLPGFTLHRELELYAQAGISAPDVLRIATLGAARVAQQGQGTRLDHAGQARRHGAGRRRSREAHR